MKDIARVDWDRFRITIVMANYNKEEYMKQAIESVLMQKTSYSYLLAIVDDCSSDSSPEIIERYEELYPDKILAVYRQENGGYFKSQLSVYHYMKSQYYTLLDPDDYWVSDCVLEKAVSFLDQNPDYSACGFNSQILKNDKFEEQFFCQTREDEKIYTGIEDYFENRCIMPHTSATFYRNSIYRNGVPSLLLKAADSLAEASFRGDTDRFIMSLKYGKIKFINKATSVYRVYEGGIWSGASVVTQCLMRARAQLDYSDFYNGKYESRFVEKIMWDKIELMQDVIRNKYHCREKDREKDIENYNYVMKKLATLRENIFTEQDIKRIWEFINEYSGQPVIVWGCGNTAENLLKRYAFRSIKYFVDSDERKQGELFHGKKIESPNEIEDGYYIILMNMYGKEIMKSIEQNKLCAVDRVINLYGYECL